LAEVILPSLGESITEGIIIRWFKSVGDSIERDEPILEISTDKVDSELPAPASGVITSILFEEGDTVEVGATVAVIGDAGDVPAPSAAPTVTTPEPDARPNEATPIAAAPKFVVDEAHQPDPADLDTVSPIWSTKVGQELWEEITRRRATNSPMIRKLLSENGLSAAAVAATGTGGRITRADAEAAVQAPRSVTENRPAALFVEAPMGSSPRGFVALEADYEAVVKAKKAPAAQAAAREGIVLDDVIFAVRAAVEALGEFPLLNASLSEGRVNVHSQRNIGVALDLEGHLLVPVIPDAQDLNLRGLSRRLADIRLRSRSGDLGVEDLIGGTFSVTAPASPRVLVSIPQLIEPQVAVLSVGGISRQAIVVSDEDGTDSIAIRSIGVLGLAFDARVVDVTTASQFLERVATLLETQDWTAEL